MSNKILIANAEIQKSISEIITYDLKNPNITGIISVLRVDTSADLETCKVFVSIFNADDKENTFNQIKHSAGYIRKALTNKIKIRKIPYLEFFLDESIDYSEKINDVISKIHDERRLQDNNEN